MTYTLHTNFWTKVWSPKHLFSTDFQNNDLTKALHRVLLCLTSISIKVETFSLYQKTIAIFAAGSFIQPTVYWHKLKVTYANRINKISCESNEGCSSNGRYWRHISIYFLFYVILIIRWNWYLPSFSCIFAVDTVVSLYKQLSKQEIWKMDRLQRTNDAFHFHFLINLTFNSTEFYEA